MFPTFDVPPQHSETVGARKARRAKEDEITRRSSSTTSHSSGSTHSATASSKRQAAANSSEARVAERSAFGWFGKSSKKGVQEISTLPGVKKPQYDQEPEIEEEPQQSVTPLQVSQEPRRIPPPRPPRSLSDQDAPAFRSQYFPHPLKSLPPPPPPPAPAFPQPPSPGLSSLPERKSQYSTVSCSSSNPTTVSSSRSVFSSNSGCNDSTSERSYSNPRYGSNVQLEPVERGSRTGSRQGEHGAKAAQAPFARALAKMEGAGARIISARLSEEWEGLDDDESYQEVVFEKRLWALTAYQRLTQNKQVQSPAHETLSNSRPADQRRILHLHGSLADGWMLAARYPAATVYTLSSVQSSSSPTSYPAPLNHHSLYVPSLSSATPFPDSYFDAIISRSVATVLRNDEWARSFFDCMRVLKSGGQIEILSVDAHMTSEGPKLGVWVDEHISDRLGALSLSRQASDTVLDTFELVGLENVRRARVALPAHSPKVMPKMPPLPSHASNPAMPVPSPQDAIETSKMMTFLGRHFYQDLYSELLQVPQGEEWFWTRKEIRDECEQYKTKMVLTIACAQKPSAATRSESYLEI